MLQLRVRGASLVVPHALATGNEALQVAIRPRRQAIVLHELKGNVCARRPAQRWAVAAPPQEQRPPQGVAQLLRLPLDVLLESGALISLVSASVTAREEGLVHKEDGLACSPREC